MKLSHRLFPRLIIIVFGWVVPWLPSSGQITPDSTLPVNSVVTPTGDIWEITGGSVAGGNLFHSFEQFSVLTGEIAFFQNSLDIQNIFSRVTGGSVSEIDGLIRANGAANLFLLNPNGIMFGPNASLDIGGSFFASTASNFRLLDETELNPIARETSPLLTINVPIGLQDNTFHPPGIVNTGQLAVEPGQNIGLLAGTIVNTGQLSAPGGRVTLATVPTLTVSGDLSSSLFKLPIASGGIEQLGLNVTDTGAVTLAESGFLVETGDIAIAPGTQGVPSVQAGTATLLAARNLSLIDAALYTTGDLNLLARDTVQVRDSIANPFYAQAGGNLHIQGNQEINLLTLNHPHTPFQSGGTLRLISNGTIFADAHFTSGGGFSILNLSGNPGNFVSLYDPIISSKEDVIIGNYTGPSLKIESMGSITAGNLVILEPDTTLQPSSDPDIPILRNSPALILRAGVDALQNPPTPIPSVVTSSPEAAIVTSSTQVYANDFENSVGDEWSNPKTDITPVGERRFLGQFGGIETVSLNLENLPEHNQATVTFDLFVIRSWDGSRIHSGPDIWNLTIPNYLALVNTTFRNPDDANNNETIGQAYPNSLFAGNNSGYAGAREINSLGYYFKNKLRNGVYSLAQVFPHSGSSLQLNFFSLVEEGIDNESWGIDNVMVSVQEAVTSSGNPLPAVVVQPPNFSTSGSRSPGSITVGNMITAGGLIILSGTSDITVNGVVRSFGGNISFESGDAIDTTAGNIDLSLDEKGGNIILKANGNIFTNQIESNGGTITLDSGATIDTTAGRIRSGFTINRETIKLIADGDIFTSDVESKGGAITLDSGGSIDTTAGLVQSRSGSNGGTITFNADGDIFAGSITSSGDRDGGDINLTSQGKLSIDRAMTEDGLTIHSDTFDFGKSGNINLTATSISVTNGAQVRTGTGLDGQQSGSEGEGGTMTITARDFVEVSGTSPDGLRISFISTASGGDRNAADLIINTQRLIVKDRGGIVTAAAGFGDGQGGDLIVNASESVELLGPSVPLQFPTGLSADTLGFSGEGDAGNLIVNTKRFIARDGAAASASTAGIPDSNRQGGNLIINASESVELSGSSVNGFASGLYTQTFGAGNGGNAIVNTPNLIVRDGAVITVSSQDARDSNLPFDLRVLEGLNVRGLDNIELFNIISSGEATGDAGSIEVDANSIVLDGQGSIVGETRTGEGGNITVETDDLQLRNGSRISTTAGIAGAGGNGGNITIVMDILAALENSDIRANAFEGNGGNIQITTQSDFRSPDSDIDASSAFGLDGTVTFNSPNTDPTSGLLTLPEELLDVASLIDRRCTPGNENNSTFTNTGIGGKPPTPKDPLTTYLGWVDRNFSPAATTASVPTDSYIYSDGNSDPVPPNLGRLGGQEVRGDRIVEAQGWIVNEQGQIELVVETDTAALDSFLLTPGCGE